MKISSPTYRPKIRIEIIPLIDVVFFLLATFLVLSLSMAKNQGIEVNLPAANSGVSKDHQSTITISLTVKGDIYLNKEKIGFEHLRARLEKLKAANSQIQVFINADEKVSVGNTVKVLDLVRTVGIAQASINVKNANPEGAK